MKLAIYLLLLLPTYAMGESFPKIAQPLVGTFLPTSEYETIQEKTTTIVDSRLGESSKIVNELKNQGFRCGKKVQVYRCVKFSENPKIDPSIDVIPLRQRIEFGSPQSLTELNEASEVTQFLMTQDIFIDDTFYKEAWYTITNRLNKVRAGEDKHPDPVHLLFEKGYVSELQFYKKTHSRFSWTEYIVEMEYR